jgi:hypothetical protein
MLIFLGGLVFLLTLFALGGGPHRSGRRTATLTAT